MDMGFGLAEGIRTPDRWLRRPLLYPTELQREKVERDVRIELTASAWKAEVLPLYESRLDFLLLIAYSGVLYI